MPTEKFPVSYNAILKRTDTVDPVVYAQTRNYTNGHVSLLSPYISRGVLSTKQVWENICKRGYAGPPSQKFLQELAWREYFQRVWQHKKDAIWDDLLHTQQEVHHPKMVQAVSSACTGIQAIDYHIQEMYATGYMHNHVRMYVASLTCNIAKAHWKQPAQWMYYHLLDGDMASNNCSWQWVSGAFSSKKYFCNQQNINQYTGSSQQGTFLDAGYDVITKLKTPQQLLAVHDLDIKTILPETPLPKIDTTRPTLLYNACNLDPLWRKNENVNRVLLLEPEHYKKYPVSEKVLSFIIALSANISNIQVYCGETASLVKMYNGATDAFISKEHPLFEYYPGKKDEREWLFPEVSGFFPSFSSYWKKCMAVTTGLSV